MLVEACVDSIASALAAQSGGASRVELCADLVEGGTTPSAGTIAVVRERLHIPLFVIIRPRGGDFLYSLEERDAMRRDIAQAKELRADGVVIGALNADGTVDQRVVRELVEEARPMRVTFHRAFDLTRDREEALETLVSLGVDRILTSGGAPTAIEGADALAALVARSADRMTVMAGGGVTEANVAELVSRSSVPEVHVRVAERRESAMRHRNERIVFGKPYTPDEYGRLETSAERVRRVLEALRA